MFGGGKECERKSQFQGIDVPNQGKGTGIISVDGTLYMWVGRPKLMAKTGLAY